jgi:peptidyl-prolyl cis-trans isomerase SurA
MVGNLLRPGALAILIALGSAPMALAPVQASEIKYIVNNVPVTSYDIQRRAAFLRLQNRGGGQQAAAEEMITQALRAAEIQRLNISVSDDQVASAYERFAQSNKMSARQMDQVLNQAGVTASHFRDYIRAQMGWSQVLSARNRSTTQMTSEQEMVQQMLQQGGEKPSATEYMLQQVIFVVPDAERSAKLGQRKRQAEAMRQRFRDCGTTREFAKGLIDVTVRDLGRVLEPELPPLWEEQIKATDPGGATAVRETERGVEFIGICSAREVSDDRAAQMVMQSQEGGDEDSRELSDKLTAELRSKARIVER